jgi:GST-like protein
VSAGIKLFYFPTPNGKKVSIALEEMGLPYQIVPIDILRGEQQQPAFLELSPNNRIPALTDEGAGGEQIRIFESGAILQYLGRKSGKIYPADEAARCWVDSWLFWQMAGLGPMAGQLSYFLRAAKSSGRDPRDTSYPLHRYRKEVARLYGVLERQLTGRDYLCDEYSIADIASWTWVDQCHEQVGGMAGFPAIAAWHARIAARPEVCRGIAVWLPESTLG